MDEEKKSLIIEIVADNKYPHVPTSHLELVGKICMALEGVKVTVKTLSVIGNAADRILMSLEEDATEE